MVLVKSNFSLSFPYRILEIPIKAANKQGPAKSPTVLETPIADSVKADAHCAIEASEAPAQIISKINSQNNGNLSRWLVRIRWSSSTSRSIGQNIKLNAFQNGIIAQSTVRIFQFSIPNTVKNSVEPKITATAPQQ